MSNPPKVVLALAGTTNWPKPNQTYERVITKFQFQEPNLSKFFNQILHGTDIFDFYGFVQKEFCFSSTNALQKIIDLFQSNENINGIYCDYVIDNKQFYLDAFHGGMSPINTSLFINSKIRNKLEFTNKNDLFTNLFTQIVNQQFLLIHMPDCLLVHD